MMSLLKNHKNGLLQEISRRQLLKIGLITAASGIIPCKTMASIQDFLYDERVLCIYNLHTEEYVDVVYWKNGKYQQNALKDMNYIFRDHYNGAVKSIDRKLLDFLYAIQQRLQCKEPFQLISGYRSPATNAKLRKNNRGVAKRSLHMKGKAADIRLPANKLQDLRSAAYELKGGGVGYYPGSNFVHVDVGRVRFWGS
jgi:uncharacterized protein YcbK (DUF882 family)